MRLEIALISPRRTIWAQNIATKKALGNLKQFIQPWYTPNLGLLTIAALTPAPAHFTYIDEQHSDISFEEEYDLIAISAMTQQAKRAYMLADQFRKRGRFVVMGGIHPTLLPNEAKRYADTIIIGEAELLWPEFIRDFLAGQPKPLYQTQNLANLEHSPVPRYDLLTTKDIIGSHDYFCMLPIQTTRGCPHDCSFCSASNVFGKKYRTKRVDQVVDEILFAKKQSPNALLVFADDNFFVKREFSRKLLQKMLALNVAWFCQSDIAVGSDTELLKLAKQAGCVGMLIGLESLSTDALLDINNNQWKAKHVGLYERYLQNIQQNGIIPYAAFIFGFDTDDPSVFKNTRDFMLQNHLIGQFTILTPLPGTRLMDRMKQENRLLYDDDWDMYTFFDVTYIPRNMSANELTDGLIWLYQQVFNVSEHIKRMEFMKAIYKRIM